MIDIHTRAHRAYQKLVTHRGGIHMQPSASLSDWHPTAKNVYVLRNGSGVLAAYRQNPRTGRLRRVEVAS